MTLALGALSLLLLAGCADDSMPGSTDSSVDGGVDASRDGSYFECAPDTECCAYRSNLDRLGAPELVATSMRVASPAGLGSGTAELGLNEALRSRAAWLFVLDEAAMTLTVGGGVYRGFVSGDFHQAWADTPGGLTDPERFARATVPARVDADGVVRAEEVAPLVRIPIASADGATLESELAIHELLVEGLPLSEDRTCVGGPSSNPLSWRYDDRSRVRGFIDVETLRGLFLTASLTAACEAVAGASCDAPQSEWPRPPSARCDEAGCEADVCDPSADCNAYPFEAALGAVGADIR